MPRLYRPHVPLKVRCQVAERQAAAKPNEVWRFYQATGWHPDMHFAKRLKVLMEALAMQFGCTVSELRLDHDPALALRQQFKNGRGEIVRYVPDANSPGHLQYRPHGAQHEGSHDVKTRIRGDHGQHSDRVLIKKARRQERGPKPKRSPPIRSRGFDKVKRPFSNRRAP